jgi:predicted acyltransferase
MAIEYAERTAPDLQASPLGPGRVFGLDALRGLAILLMCLSGLVPKVLPNWMDHGYNAHYLPNAAGEWVLRTDEAFKTGENIHLAPWASFTWVDWVFPGFLFAMGAAIPLAFSIRRAKGDGWLKLVGHVFSRWLLLIFFAVYVEQVTVGAIGGDSGTAARWMALLGFVLPFAIFARLPRETPPQLARAVRAFGWISCVGLLLFLNTRGGRQFTWRNDVIILLLAHTYLIGALLWMAVPGKLWWLRLLVALPLMLLAHHQALTYNGGKDKESVDVRWADHIHSGLQARLDAAAGPMARAKQYLNLPEVIERNTNYTVKPELRGYLNFAPLWDFTWYKFLWCVVAGTVIGDVLLRRRADDAAVPRGLALALTGLILAFTIGVFAGLRHYGYPKDAFVLFRTPWLMLTIAGPMLVGLIVLTFLKRPQWPTLFVPLVTWGSIWAVAGMVLCVLPMDGTPNGFFERGISKGPPATLSWYFLANGLSIFWLLLLSLWIDTRRARGFGLLVANGQNPMLAYIAIRNLLAPLVTLPLLYPVAKYFQEQVSLDAFAGKIAEGPWAGFVWALLKTLLLAAMVWAFTRRRVVWRA